MRLRYFLKNPSNTLKAASPIDWRDEEDEKPRLMPVWQEQTIRAIGSQAMHVRSQYSTEADCEESTARALELEECFIRMKR